MKKAINLYVHGSLHVGLAILSLTLITYYFFGINTNLNVLMFVFFSSVIGYNYTKFPNYLFKKSKDAEFRLIQFLSLTSIGLSFWLFFKFNFESKILVLLVALLTILYAFKNKNIRNISGIKIYVVAFCWVATTLLLPVFEADFPINSDVLIKCFQRFLLVIVLILIFEIIDLKEDAPNLKTVPQTIGVRNTKILGIVLMIIFFFLEFLLSNWKTSQLVINGVLALVVLAFTVLATENRSKYYTTFWVESIPIFWLGLIILFR